MNDGYRLKVKAWLNENKVTNPFTNSIIGTKLELIELGKRLNDNEDIVYLTACKLGDKRVLVCVTNARLLILDKGLLFDLYQNTLFLDDIANIERGRSFYFGDVHVHTKQGSTLTLHGFWADDTEEFFKKIEQARYNLKFGLHQSKKYKTEMDIPYGSRDDYPEVMTSSGTPLYMGNGSNGYGNGSGQGYNRQGVSNTSTFGNAGVWRGSQNGVSSERANFVQRQRTPAEMERLRAKKKAYAELEYLLKHGMIDQQTFNNRVRKLKEG